MNAVALIDEGTASVDAETPLTGRACWELLAAADTGILTDGADDATERLPVTIHIVDGRLLLQVQVDRRLPDLDLGGPLALEVEGPRGDDLWSVVVAGHAHRHRRPPTPARSTGSAASWVPLSRALSVVMVADALTSCRVASPQRSRRVDHGTATGQRSPLPAPIDDQLVLRSD